MSRDVCERVSQSVQARLESARAEKVANDEKDRKLRLRHFMQLFGIVEQWCKRSEHIGYIEEELTRRIVACKISERSPAAFSMTLEINFTIDGGGSEEQVFAAFVEKSGGHGDIEKRVASYLNLIIDGQLRSITPRVTPRYDYDLEQAVYRTSYPPTGWDCVLEVTYVVETKNYEPRV